jgi:hypothetical protein
VLAAGAGVGAAADRRRCFLAAVACFRFFAWASLRRCLLAAY